MEEQNNSIIFCSSCGQKISLKSKFCWKCGSKINVLDEKKEIDNRLNNCVSKKLDPKTILEEKHSKPEIKVNNQKKNDNTILKIAILVILTLIFALIVDPPDFSSITNIFKGKFTGKVVTITFPNEKNGTYGEGWNKKFYSNSRTGLVKSYKKNDYIDIQSIYIFQKTLGDESRLILKNRIYTITILANSTEEYFYR